MPGLARPARGVPPGKYLDAYGRLAISRRLLLGDGGKRPPRGLSVDDWWITFERRFESIPET